MTEMLINFLIKKTAYVLSAWILVFAISSCNTTKYLKNDEFLLEKNRVNIETPAKSRETGSLEWNLKTLAKQKPNKKSVGLFRPRLWWHYKAQKHIKNNVKKDSIDRIIKTDTSRFYKFILRRVAEPPALYDKEKTKETAKSMEYYLNNKGFYGARVNTQIKTKKRLVYVTYEVTTDSFMRVGSIQYETEDDNLRPFLKEIKKGSLIKRGEPLSSSTFNSEKNRIIKILKNEGYRFFYPNYVVYEGDSTGLKTNVKAIILRPSDSTYHKKYHIGNIYIHTQYSPTANIKTAYDTIYNNGYYFIKRTSDSFNIKQETIINSLYLKHGDIFSQDINDKSRRRLGKLSMYKFISLKSIPVDRKDSTNRNYIDYNIYLTPDNKLSLNYDASVNYISGDNTIGEALGLFANATYRNKNVFKGGELLSFNLGYGIESPVNGATLIDFKQSFTQDFRVQADLSLPPFYRNFNLRISTAYNLVQRFEQYDYNLITTGLSIDVKPNNNLSASLKFLSLNYLSATIDPNFQSTLDDNPLLERSFDPQFVIGGNYNIVYTKQNSGSNENYSLRLGLDLSGNVLNLLDQAINPSVPFFFGKDSITYSQYSLLELDGRYFKNFGRNVTIATRINTGIGLPYGNSKDAGLPYVKQFFAGGNSSIRAWRVRQLGPGGTANDPNLENIVPFQTGDFKFVGNIEGRFNMGFLAAGLESALFVDVGNVWSFTDDSEDEIKLLTTDNFLKRMAIGAGAGIRYDFSFFILRIDYAWRVRRAYSGTGDDNDLSTFWESQHESTSNGRVNLAIGYPF